MRFKKEIILIISITSFIILLEIITTKYTKKIVSSISQDANNVISELYEKNVGASIDNLKKNWYEKQNILSCYIEHNELEKVTSSLILLEENAKNKEYEQALSNSKEFLYWLEHFKEKDELLIKNIL